MGAMSTFYDEIGGMETIRRFVDFAGPAVYAVMMVLCIYLLVKAKFDISLNLSDVHLSGVTSSGSSAARSRPSSPTSPGRCSTSATSPGTPGRSARSARATGSACR